jgi:hypothetical protein
MRKQSLKTPNPKRLPRTRPAIVKQEKKSRFNYETKQNHPTQ